MNNKLFLIGLSMVLFLSMISVANAEPGIDFVGQTISPYGWTVDNYADGSSVCVV